MILTNTKYFKPLKSALSVAIAAILSAWVLKLLVFNYYVVPSESMEPTLFPGDGLIISKLTYGPRLDIRSIFLFEKTRLGKRLPGLYNVNRNDVIVFNSPLNLDDNLVKRCVALPGDTISIDQGDVYINSHTKSTPIRDFIFELSTKHPESFVRILDSLKIVYTVKNDLFTITTSTATATFLSTYEDILTVTRVNPPISRYQRVFPNALCLLWDKNYYGPLIVPKKGVKIPINSNTFRRYKSVLMMENSSLLSDSNKIYRDKFISSYVFKENYYFMMGDNRNNSFDSRWIGFIPAKLIIGKVEMVIFSKEPYQYKIRWKRLFKWIR